MTFASVLPEIATHVAAQAASQVFAPNRIPELGSTVSSRYLNQDQRRQMAAMAQYRLKVAQSKLYQPVRQSQHYRVPTPLRPSQYINALLKPPNHQHLKQIYRSDGRKQIVQESNKPNVSSRFVPLLTLLGGLFALGGLSVWLFSLLRRR